MQNSFKKLIASTLACGTLLSFPTSALNPGIEREFRSTFEGRVILHEDFLNPDKFPMADTDQITEKMTKLFKKYPNLAKKLTSRRPLVIKPFELDGRHCPNAPEDSVELLSGMFRYKVEESTASLFIDALDTHFALCFIKDAQNIYAELLNAELISLLIHIIICDRHISDLETPNRPLPDRYFDETKEEIIALARAKHGYVGTGNLLGVGDYQTSSKEWLLGLIADILTGKETFDVPLRAAAHDWLKAQ